MTIESPRTYPDTLRIAGHDITLRPMTAGDRAAVLEFARKLPEHDLLFLRRDLTQDAAVDDWIREIAVGEIFTVLAVEGDSLLGWATIHRNRLRWTAHVAELRVMVA
ncbi:MAG: GNAT family N-acetyltransferase, partial [Dehalococcoidia bacterium]|nr:GNAT family N-acetyltransferase [Dehalococcoidia bacterium]